MLCVGVPVQLAIQCYPKVSHIWDHVYSPRDCRLYSSRFLAYIGISADFSLEISSLCSFHHVSILRSVLSSVLRMSAVDGPCNIIIMSSAYTTSLTFGALESSAIRLLIIIFHKVGPETDPWGQPLVTRLELTDLPSIKWALRSLRKSLTKL